MLETLDVVVFVMIVFIFLSGDACAYFAERTIRVFA